MTPDANRHVSGRLFMLRQSLIDFAAGRRTMTPEEARQMDGLLKNISLQAIRVENHMLQLDPAGHVVGADVATMAQLYTVPDGCIDLAKALMDFCQHVSELHPDDVAATARRAMELASTALILVQEVSRHCWNDLARQERVEREADAAAARDRAIHSVNVRLLGRERPIAD